MRRLVVIFLTLLSMVGCRLAPLAPQTPLPGSARTTSSAAVQAQAQQDPTTLTGRVYFPSAQRQTQASMAEVGIGSTVALISTSTGQTVASTVTDASGSFVLSNLNPTSGYYYLEAIKGLGNRDAGGNLVSVNKPGYFAVRVRTMVQFSSSWSSLTHNAIGGALLVTPQTTAVSIGAALRNGNPSPFDFSTLITSVSNGTTYSPVSGLSQGDFDAILALVNQLLSADQDPMACIALSGSNWVSTNQIGGLVLSSLTPNSGTVGTTVTAQGYGFLTPVASNTILFNGIPAVATAGNKSSLTVTVPSGATSGPVSIKIGPSNGAYTTVSGENSLAFTVSTSLTGFAPPSGVTGTSVTINGSGFDLTSLANNVVQFGGVTGTTTAVTATSVTATVPSAALTGRITVTIAGSTGTSAGTFTVTPVITNVNPLNIITNDSITITGTGFSTTPASNTIVFGAITIPTAKILSCSPNTLTIQLPTVTATGSVKLTTPGSLQAVGTQTYTVVTPTLFAMPSYPLAAGSVLNIEGNFPGPAGSVTFNFPGGSSVAATSWSSNRAQVTVPAGAISGNLSVTMTIGGTPTTPLTTLPFRKLGYSLGLGAFNPENEQPGKGFGGRLFAARFNHASVALPDRQAAANTPTGDFFFLIGGTSTGANALNTTEYAKLNADGSLSGIVTAGPALVTSARNLPASALVAYGTNTSYLYVLGGLNGSALASVERSAIAATGVPGAFVASTPMLNARYGHAAVVIGNSLYVIGGTNGTSMMPMERSIITTAGVLGAFATTSVDVVTRRSQFSTAVIGSYLYVFGGKDSTGTALTSIERAAINGDGTLGSFSAVGNLALARYGFSSFVSGNSLVVVGGTTTGTSALTSVEQATINADGSLGTFAVVSSSPLITSRFGQAGAVVGSNYYALGGTSNGTVALNTVERASLNTSGAFGTFALATATPLATARNYAASVIIGNWLYVIGGQNGTTTNNIERALINPNGTLGSFASYTTLAVARYGHAVAVVGNYLYVIGGTATGTSPIVVANAIERFTINWSNGSIGSGTSINNMKVPRWGHSVAVVGNNLYVIGGTANGTAALPSAPVGTSTSVEMSALTFPAGTSAAFATVSVPISTPRFYGSSAVIGNYLYLLGGTTNGTTMLSNVERSQISAGALTAFSAYSNSLQTARCAFTTAVVGSNLYACGGTLAGGGNTTSIEQSAITSTGPDPFTACANSLSVARDRHVGAVSGNYFYVLGGASGTSVDRAQLQ